MIFRKNPKHRRHVPENDESLQAIVNAETHLEEVQSRAQEVTEIASTARRIRTRNHFGETLQAMLSAPPHERSHP